MTATDGACLEVARVRLRQWLGVDLARGGVANNVARHVERRLRELKEPGATAFAALLDAPGSREAQLLVEAATVPHSWLFRDLAQLRALQEVLGRRRRGALHVWVPGCAHGEDAATVAIIALQANHDVSVLASDVNEGALKQARAGVFDAWASRQVPPDLRRHVRPLPDGGCVLDDEVRRRIQWLRHSLVHTPPVSPTGQGWDLIVCRNVLIYFTREDALDIVRRLTASLATDGLLVLGASDVLVELPAGLMPVADSGRLVLTRTAPGMAPPTWMPPPTPLPSPLPSSLPSSMPAPLPTSVPAAGPMVPFNTAGDRGTADGVLMLLERGDAAGARAAADERLAVDAMDAEAHFLAGLAWFGEGHYVEAIQRLRAACFLAPGAWASWLHLGLASERLGWWDDAARAFHQVTCCQGSGAELPAGRGELATALRGGRAALTEMARGRVRSLRLRDGESR